MGRLEERSFSRWREAVEAWLAEKQSSAALLQASFRGLLSRRTVSGMRQEQWAACLLQRIWRGKKGRGELGRRDTRKHAALCVQAHFRGHRGRQRYTRLRQQWVLKAAAMGDYEMLRWHLECGRGFVVDEHGTTALMASARVRYNFKLPASRVPRLAPRLRAPPETHSACVSV